LYERDKHAEASFPPSRTRGFGPMFVNSKNTTSSVVDLSQRRRGLKSFLFTPAESFGSGRHASGSFAGVFSRTPRHTQAPDVYFFYLLYSGQLSLLRHLRCSSMSDSPHLRLVRINSAMWPSVDVADIVSDCPCQSS
jgi:hypothetical protein